MAEMKLSAISRRLSVLLFLLGGPLAGQTSLSIYSDGRVVVRRSLPQPLEKGRNALTLELDGVDPATLFSPDTSVTVVSAVLWPATERGAALQRAAGQTLAFVRGKGDTVRATVVRASPPQYRLPDGRLLLIEPGEPLFPPELVRTAPQASLVLNAARARPSTELAFVTEGARWSAVYQVVLEAGRASVSGSAAVVSQRLRAESASVQLVAGTIGRASRAPPPPMMVDFAPRAAVVAQERQSAAEEVVGEAHVYTLPARINLEPGVPVATALFPRTLVAVTQELIVPGTLPFRGYLQSSGEPNRVPVQVWYTLSRPRGTPFGERPLPGGTVQVYQVDSAGRPQLVGEAGTDHTAPGRDLRIQSGDAFDVTAERVQTDYLQEQIPPIRRGLPPRQRFTASYRVTLSNAKPAPVTVDVREARAGTWVVVTSSVPPEKLSATEVRFRLAVPAKGEATLTYAVQVDS
jgi:hypothetical protein